MQLALSRISRNLAPPFGSVRSGKNRYCSVFQFFGLKENPFHISPDPRYLSFARQTQDAFDAVTYGIAARQGLIVLTGEVGTGKTTLTNHLLNWLRQRQTPASFIVNPHLGAADLYDFMLADFGIPCEASQQADKPALLNSWLFAHHSSGKTPILVVDEAHGLPLNVLEEIRLLLNLETAQQKLLQIVLVGQPELEEKLGRPRLLKLRQRVGVHCKIGPLNEAETRRYIYHRVSLAGGQVKSVFTSDAIGAVHFYSRGIPRVINILCEHALINAFADQLRPVPFRLVKEVAQECQFSKIGNPEARFEFRSNKTPSISTILRTHPIEAPEPVPTDQFQIQLGQMSLAVREENSAVAASLVTENLETASPSIAMEAALGRRRSFSGDASAALWRRWNDKSIVNIGFPILRRAAASVVRWLQQPVPRLHERHRLAEFQGPDRRPLEVLSARVRGEVRRAWVRLRQGAKARLEP